MKQLFRFWIVAALLFMVGCSKEYDDSALVGRVDDLESRVQKLEQLCQQMNTNISSLQTIVTALQNNDYVTGVTPITENGKTIGYTITFAKAQSITIYHGKDGQNGADGKDGQDGADGKDGINGTDGKDGEDGKDGADGKDGYTPVIGVKQDTDGIYYWTLDGEWLLDDAGNKIKAVGTDGKDGADGKDGQDGADGKDGINGTDGKDGEDGKDGTDGINGADGKDGITPQLKIEDNYWYVSYDNGSSWTQLGKATGEDGKDGTNGTDGTNGADGKSFFQDVTQDDNNVYFTLADGTVITVPKGLALSIEFAESDLVVMSPNSTREIGYTITSATETVKVEVTSSADIKAKAVADNASGLTGKIHITTGDAIDEYSKVIVFVSNGDKVIMRSITFEEAGLVVEENATKQATSEGGEMTLEFLSNVECEVIIPEEAQSWISVVPTTRAMEKQTITLKLEPNEGIARSAEVVVKSIDGLLSLTYTIKQKPNLNSQLALEREALIAFYNATGGTDWVYNDNWCSDKPVNEWYGVYTDESGFVTSIELCIPENSLQGNNLSGTLPSEFINLKNLFTFRVDNCEQFLCDGIPDVLFEMHNLTDLILPGCGLTGSIPEKISKLSNLRFLNLQSNKLTGTIPASIAEIKDLATLWLSGNSLEGDVPQAIQDMDLWIRDWTNICSQKGAGLNPETLSIPFPEFDFTTLSGERITNDYFESCEYTIFYHYGYECPFAEIYTPKLVRLYNMYKNRGIGVLSFGSGSITTPEQMRTYVESNNITWPNVFIESKVAHTANKGYSQYVTTMPTVCVIDNTGKVIFNHIFDNRETLGEFLKQKLGEAEVDIYESMDYSDDGKVSILQEAKTGNGVDVVLLGDGYSDRLIADGTYDKDMKKMMDTFFSVEPYASFKDYFNVYSVVAVSKNELFDNSELMDFGAETAFSGWFGHGTEVGGDDGECFRYAQKAVSSERMDEVLIIVSLNAHNISGTCYMYAPDANNDYGSGASIAYFASGNVDDYTYRLVHHEAGGHGFAKLADEYAYENYGAIPEDIIAAYNLQYNQYGWWKNVDFTADATNVKWSKFLKDERYFNEGLGIFEGALTYWSGAYRPSQNSIMKDNDGYFNAPSREAIYYRIHKLAYGDSWEYDYEDFVEWDARNRTTAATRAMVYKPANYKPTHPPVIVNKSWKDAK